MPWTDLLDYSCVWAEGQSGQNDVCYAETFGTFWASPIYYDQSSQGFFEYISNSNYQYRYNLKNALNLALTYGAVPMDCQDVSGFLHQAMQSQGHSATIVRIGIHPWDMLTNILCPIGSDASSILYYSMYWFGGHQLLQLNGVHDACVAQWKQPDGNPYYNPPSGWYYPDYIQAFPSGYPSPYLGLLRNNNSPTTNYPDPDIMTPNSYIATLTEIK